MSMQREYQRIDFSRFSRVQDTLLERLHREHRQSSNKVELNLDALNYVSAAGPHGQFRPDSAEKSTEK